VERHPCAFGRRRFAALVAVFNSMMLKIQIYNINVKVHFDEYRNMSHERNAP
jgi:hypothetical protein